MKKYYRFLFIILILTGLDACKKDTPVDYRDIVVGNYTGISVREYYYDSMWHRDTTNVVILLDKSPTDSIIDFTFNPPNEVIFSFKYENGNFSFYSETFVTHPPHMWKVNDSLFLLHSPGQGPLTYECYTTKQN